MGFAGGLGAMVQQELITRMTQEKSNGFDSEIRVKNPLQRRSVFVLIGTAHYSKKLSPQPLERTGAELRLAIGTIKILGENQK